MKDKLKLVGYSILCLLFVWTCIAILNMVIYNATWEIENNGGLKAATENIWCGNKGCN